MGTEMRLHNMTREGDRLAEFINGQNALAARVRHALKCFLRLCFLWLERAFLYDSKDTGSCFMSDQN